MNPVNEKYFNGEMDAEERALLEQELNQNPGLRDQFESDREFLEALKNQMLRRKIKMALAGQPEVGQPGLSTRNKSRWIGLGLVVMAIVICGVWSLFYSSSSESDTAPPDNVRPPEKLIFENPPAPIAEQPVAPEQKKNGPDKTRTPQRELLAEIPVEPHSLEGMRGGGTSNTPWSDLVNKVWHAPLPGGEAAFGGLFQPVSTALRQGSAPDAFIEIRKLERQLPANDTLAFLKGFCLMQLWQGREALNAFKTLVGKPHPWTNDVAWYTGLCNLLTGEKTAATEAFKQIAAQSGHPYQKFAKKALVLLN